MPTLIAISLGASCLPYGSLCIRSLAENLHGDEAIHLLTDLPGIKCGSSRRLRV